MDKELKIKLSDYDLSSIVGDVLRKQLNDWNVRDMICTEVQQLIKIEVRDSMKTVIHEKTEGWINNELKLPRIYLDHNNEERAPSSLEDMMKRSMNDYLNESVNTYGRKDSHGVPRVHWIITEQMKKYADDTTSEIAQSLTDKYKAEFESGLKEKIESGVSKIFSTLFKK